MKKRFGTYPSEVLFGIFILLSRLISDLRRKIVSPGISLAYSYLSRLRKALRKDIFTNYSWNMAFVTRNMLETEFVSRACNPILSFFTRETENILGRLVGSNGSSSLRCWGVIPYGMSASNMSSLWSLKISLTSIIDDFLINLACSHGKEIIFGWHKPSVARQVISFEDRYLSLHKPNL